MGTAGQAGLSGRRQMAGLGGWRRVAGRVVWRRVARELVLVAVFLAVYEEIRWHMVQAGGAAASHALSVVSAEQALGLFHERAIQAAFTPWDSITDTFNAYYGGTHFLVPAAILVWLVLRHPERYARARTALAVMTAVAFVGFWLYPVAPPRLLPASFGFVDTLRAGASGHLEGSLINTAGDQYASMPSLHVAWAVWCALALYPMVRHWALRALVVAYPVMTTLVVVATGNHYFLDAAAGTLLACLVWAVVSRAARTGGEPGPHPGDRDGEAEAEREVLVVGSGAFGHGGRGLRRPDRRGRTVPGRPRFPHRPGFRGDLMDDPVDDLPSRQPALTVAGGRAVHDPDGLFG